MRIQQFNLGNLVLCSRVKIFPSSCQQPCDLLSKVSDRCCQESRPSAFATGGREMHSVPLKFVKRTGNVETIGNLKTAAPEFHFMLLYTVLKALAIPLKILSNGTYQPISCATADITGCWVPVKSFQHSVTHKVRQESRGV